MPVKSPLSDDARKIVGEALQGALVDLIDLSLLAKQAHWNLVGPRFRSVHLQLDEVVVLARQYTDMVAERATAIGWPPDGRARTVAERRGIPQLDAGWLQDTAVIAAFVDLFGAVIGRMRERIAETAEPDPVTQDLLIGLTAQLEKQHWMFQAEHVD